MLSRNICFMVESYDLEHSIKTTITFSFSKGVQKRVFLSHCQFWLLSGNHTIVLEQFTLFACRLLTSIGVLFLLIPLLLAKFHPYNLLLIFQLHLLCVFFCFIFLATNSKLLLLLFSNTLIYCLYSLKRGPLVA